MQSRYYGAIIEHKFSHCQEENVAGGGSPQRALRTQRKGFRNKFRVVTSACYKTGIAV